MKHNDSYKRYRLKEVMKLVKFFAILTVITLSILFTPEQATQLAGIIGAFAFGASKYRNTLGS